MSEAIATELGKLENDGVEAFDAHLKEFVIVVSPLLCIVADNPPASEILNHLGGSARRYCRMCMVSTSVQCTCMYNYMYHICTMYMYTCIIIMYIYVHNSCTRYICTHPN